MNQIVPVNPVREVHIDEVIRPGATSKSVDAGVMGKLPENLKDQLGDIAAQLQASGVSPVFEGSMPIWRR